MIRAAIAFGVATSIGALVGATAGVIVGVVLVEVNRQNQQTTINNSSMGMPPQVDLAQE